MQKNVPTIPDHIRKNFVPKTVKRSRINSHAAKAGSSVIENKIIRFTDVAGKIALAWEGDHQLVPGKRLDLVAVDHAIGGHAICDGEGYFGVKVSMVVVIDTTVTSLNSLARLRASHLVGSAPRTVFLAYDKWSAISLRTFRPTV